MNAYLNTLELELDELLEAGVRVVLEPSVTGVRVVLEDGRDTYSAHGGRLAPAYTDALDRLRRGRADVSP